MTAAQRILVGALLIAGAGAIAAAEPGDAVNGRRLYVDVGCFECHGRVGEGGAFNGPAPALAQIQKGMSLEAFAALIRMGPNDMPAYTKKDLSDKDLADIVAYLRTLPGPGDPKNFPLLNK